MIAEKIDAPLEAQLDANGFILVPGFLQRPQALALRDLYATDDLFRSRIVMERHNFGRGEYQYFKNPLPAPVRELRENLYHRLVPVANAWMLRLSKNVRFPASHQEFLNVCASADQHRPTALLLKYGPGDYNCLHQDIYGPVAFPLQATVYLSEPNVEFGGGEVVLTEQRPRAQTRAHVLSPAQGDLLVLPTAAVPRQGRSGAYRATFKHGVSTLHWGERFTLGLVLHDAA